MPTGIEPEIVGTMVHDQRRTGQQQRISMQIPDAVQLVELARDAGPVWAWTLTLNSIGQPRRTLSGTVPSCLRRAISGCSVIIHLERAF
ncbi:MAG: hypothetical protein ABL888_22280 [Pirellulaceae bacterium]